MCSQFARTFSWYAFRATNLTLIVSRVSDSPNNATKISFAISGIGWGMFCVSIFTGIYYVMIVAWCAFYMVSSFASDVPWRSCDQDWNTDGMFTELNITFHMIKFVT